MTWPFIGPAQWGVGTSRHGACQSTPLVPWSHGSVGLNNWTAKNTPQIHKWLPPGKLHGCGSQHIALHSSAPNSGSWQAGIQQDSGGSGPSPTSPVQQGGFSIGKPPIARSRCSRRSTTESCASVIHLYICDSSIHRRLAWRTQTDLHR